ncbi:hypothetical protein ST64987_p0002 (plasmid) [Streptococcus thermophilus]|nr:hypothetical protein ST64987_p0002 [Streptococcus thermophilus]
MRPTVTDGLDFGQTVWHYPRLTCDFCSPVLRGQSAHFSSLWLSQGWHWGTRLSIINNVFLKEISRNFWIMAYY